MIVGVQMNVTTSGGAMLVLEIVAVSWIALLCASESVYHPGTATMKSETGAALSSLVVTHIMKFRKVHPSRYQCVAENLCFCPRYVQT